MQAHPPHGRLPDQLNPQQRQPDSKTGWTQQRGLATRLACPASASVMEWGRRGSSSSCVTPITPHSRARTRSSWWSRRGASGPSGSLQITARPAKKSRVTRVRSLSCTISTRTGEPRSRKCVHHGPSLRGSAVRAVLLISPWPGRRVTVGLVERKLDPHAGFGWPYGPAAIAARGPRCR
jgi:hypothetical protein